jgi:hypothetical protein
MKALLAFLLVAPAAIIASPAEASRHASAPRLEKGDKAVSGHCRVELLTPPDRRTSAQFSVTRVLGLHFRVQSAPRGLAPQLRLRAYSPDGRLYQVLRPIPASAASASAPPSTGASAESVEAMEEDAAPSGGRPPRFVDIGLPIAGSQVMWGSLYGRWTIVPSFEGAERPCGSALSFVIQP